MQGKRKTDTTKTLASVANFWIIFYTKNANPLEFQLSLGYII